LLEKGRLSGADPDRENGRKEGRKEGRKLAAALFLCSKHFFLSLSTFLFPLSLYAPDRFILLVARRAIWLRK
jgi:hypothetical protein